MSVDSSRMRDYSLTSFVRNLSLKRVFDILVASPYHLISLFTSLPCRFDFPGLSLLRRPAKLLRIQPK